MSEKDDKSGSIDAARPKEEALRLKTLAEEKYNSGDLTSAVAYAERARDLHPSISGLRQMLTAFQILRAAAAYPFPDGGAERQKPTPDYYRILQVQRFSHINSIKKQYKKLALTLHPDKNPFVASEEAFKLVGEAARVLSDKIRRKEYDIRLRIAMQSEAAGAVAVELGEEGSRETFWTACSACRLLHQFERKYLGHNLICPGCKKTFKAMEAEERNEDEGKNEKNEANTRVSARIQERVAKGGYVGSVEKFGLGVKRRNSNLGEVSERSGAKMARTGASRRQERVEISGEGDDVENGRFKTMETLVNGGEEALGVREVEIVENETSKGGEAREEESMTLSQMQMIVKKKNKRKTKEIAEGKMNTKTNKLVEGKLSTKTKKLVERKLSTKTKKLVEGKLSTKTKKLVEGKSSTMTKKPVEGKLSTKVKEVNAEKLKVNGVVEETEKDGMRDREKEDLREEEMENVRIEERVSEKVDLREEESVEEMENVRTEERAKEREGGAEKQKVVNLRENSNRRRVPKVRNLEAVHAASRNHLHSEIEKDMSSGKGNSEVLLVEKEKEKEMDVTREKKGRRRVSKCGNSEILNTKSSKNRVDSDLQRLIANKKGDLEIMAVEDSDFHDFDKDRMERSFKKGQVWAVYDDVDAMPRQYGLINEIVCVNPFQVTLSWLQPQNNGDVELIGRLEKGFCVSCGSFQVARKVTIRYLNLFSHLVDCERAARELYRIYPKKGSVWAVYSSSGREAEERDERNKDKRCYNIVVTLSSYSDVHGLSIAYLKKVDGFRTVFKRREIGANAVVCLGAKDIKMFSHQIPAKKLSGEEASGLPKDCWELDPASLTPQVLTIA
ncbi:uncharacterized protein LOC131024541 [Salvia miltiorrhiza]|uniref:uncharacterized protein LOC131024541 n=1 Tax=Salvia miltiorrhiza TaxID=226208 RepID=UPI0025AC6D78|nr:uncharacterized protein LOC131024541 [Salvia miltiorrhiza]XP_057810034.1 uncharacterized protein LOC131024541 [Salvia miltiorrhiza]